MDKRKRNNMSATQRRQIVAGTRKKARTKTDKTALDHAKTVLRQRGHEVYEASLIDSRFAGSIYVDARRRTPVEVIEMAREIEENEARRNAALRKEHGLA